MTPDSDLPIEVRSTSVSATPSREYEFAATATLTIRGLDGELRLQRRYEALPRHNDVVAPEAIDSNDELVDRANAIHVHTKFFAIEGGVAEYFLDSHETWTPVDLSPLSNERSFIDACRDHNLADLHETYRRAMARRRSTSGPGSRSGQ